MPEASKEEWDSLKHPSDLNADIRRLQVGRLASEVAAAAKDGATEESNPKDMIGSMKAQLSCLPIRVLWRVGLAMLEGAVKYGRHNYRAVGVRASVYFDASCRHLFGWWEGEDIDPDSGVNHIDKAIAGLMVLRDSMLEGNWEDDRPPSAQVNFSELNASAAKLIEQHKDKNPKHYTKGDK